MTGRSYEANSISSVGARLFVEKMKTMPQSSIGATCQVFEKLTRNILPPICHAFYLAYLFFL